MDTSPPRLTPPDMKQPSFKLVYTCVLLCPLLLACASQRDRSVIDAQLAPPAWPVATQTADALQRPVPERWLTTLDAPLGGNTLQRFVDSVLANNTNLRQQAAQLALARERIDLALADRLPSLGVSLGGSRGRAFNNSPITENYTLSANASFEIDLWGKLAANQRAAYLDYLSAQAQYQDVERRLVATAVTTTFDAITAQQLQDLFEQRLETLSTSLDIIQSGYRSGLNEALDVYLAQTTLQQERSRVASQSQVSYQARTDLQLLVNAYPDAQITTPPALPKLGDIPGLGTPAYVLTERPDIQAAWYALLAADADLAVAHKNRFPGLSLTASSSDSDNALHTLLDGGQLAWSVAASLLQPVYQGGRLRSLERQARISVQQAEARYLEVVFNAFAQVQNAINNATQLRTQFEALQLAEQNAVNALKLANDQYQRGLINYATVLESQRRAFDTQTSVVQLRNQLLANRVNLLLALGGNY